MVEADEYPGAAPVLGGLVGWVVGGSVVWAIPLLQLLMSRVSSEAMKCLCSEWVFCLPIISCGLVAQGAHFLTASVQPCPTLLVYP